MSEIRPEYCDINGLTQAMKGSEKDRQPAQKQKALELGKVRTICRPAHSPVDAEAIFHQIWLSGNGVWGIAA